MSEARTRQAGRALVVDDDEEVRTVLALMLEHHGFAVITAADGGEAVTLARDHAFDVVFTDLCMPGRSGWEVAAEVKRVQPAARVILVTGWPVDLPPEELHARGLDALLTKPCTLEEVGAAAHGCALASGAAHP